VEVAGLALGASSQDPGQRATVGVLRTVLGVQHGILIIVIVLAASFLGYAAGRRWRGPSKAIELSMAPVVVWSALALASVVLVRVVYLLLQVDLPFDAGVWTSMKTRFLWSLLLATLLVFVVPLGSAVRLAASGAARGRAVVGACVVALAAFAGSVVRPPGAWAADELACTLQRADQLLSLESGRLPSYEAVEARLRDSPRTCMLGGMGRFHLRESSGRPYLIFLDGYGGAYETLGPMSDAVDNGAEARMLSRELYYFWWGPW
jgi:hypothetical protein